MKIIKLVVVAALLVTVAGCNHMRDMMACQPKIKSPELFTDAGGWDHRSPEEVSCSKEAYEAAKLARINAERTAIR
jgi:hypothetical protein